MRLLNVQTRRLEWFNSSSDVTYAILSHVWDREEILYEDIIRDDSASMQKKHGFAKFANACKLAARQGHQYLWNDTCCIDKSSSAELSEAINSMFRYYEDSLVCFAYLEDVLGPSLDSFPKSKWFTRSWTLQETVAPTRVEFYDRDWNYLGSKEHLAPTIASITLIDEDVLLQSARGTDALNDKSIAKRMSWAANRQATREEDVAYSLLGIFDVSMPLLYGEGIIKAFNRLQIEIMKDSPDMSILAWTRESTTNQSGVLAVHPGDFRGAANVIPIPRLQEPFAVTNNGLQMLVPLIRDGASVWAILNCREDGDYRGPIAIPLERITSTRSDRDTSGMIYNRLPHTQPKTTPENTLKDVKEENIYIVINLQRQPRAKASFSNVWVQHTLGMKVVTVTPKSAYDGKKIMFDTSKVDGKRLGSVVFYAGITRRVYIMLSVALVQVGPHKKVELCLSASLPPATYDFRKEQGEPQYNWRRGVIRNSRDVFSGAYSCFSSVEDSPEPAKLLSPSSYFRSKQWQATAEGRTAVMMNEPVYVANISFQWL